MDKLLKAAKEAAALLHRIQEAEDGPMPAPWPEIEALEEAIAKAEVRTPTQCLDDTLKRMAETDPAAAQGIQMMDALFSSLFPYQHGRHEAAQH